MTISRQPDSPATSEVIVRDYAEGGYGARACEHHALTYSLGVAGPPPLALFSLGAEDVPLSAALSQQIGGAE
jgi:hypothetical protein